MATPEGSWESLGLRGVLTGRAATGEAWTLLAGGEPGRLHTVLEIESAGGVEGGGMGGPALPSGRVVNVFWGVSADGHVQVLGRTGPEVHEIRLHGASLPLSDPHPDFGVRFFAAVLPSGTAPGPLLALDREGHELDRTEPVMPPDAAPRRRGPQPGRGHGGWLPG